MILSAAALVVSALAAPLPASDSVPDVAPVVRRVAATAQLASQEYRVGIVNGRVVFSSRSGRSSAVPSGVSPNGGPPACQIPPQHYKWYRFAVSPRECGRLPRLRGCSSKAAYHLAIDCTGRSARSGASGSAVVGSRRRSLSHQLRLMPRGTRPRRRSDGERDGTQARRSLRCG